MKHLSSEDLQSLKTDLDLVGQAEALWHLLLCSHCRKRASARFVLDEDETWDEPLSVFAGATLGRAVESLQKRLSHSRADDERADLLCAELLAQPPARRIARVVGENRFLSPAIADRLLAAAEAARDDHPRTAERLAELALEIGLRLPRQGGVERAALLGRARSWIGEMKRVQGDFAGADVAYEKAFRELEVLPLASPERAEFCQLLARLRREQGRDEEALALIARAVEVYESVGHARKMAECRLEQGSMLLSELEAEEALPAFEEAAASFRDPADFPAWLAARRGLALSYADLRMRGRARGVVQELVHGAAARPEIDRLRVLRVEAQVELALDDGGRAAAILAEVWPLLEAEGETFEAVSAVFDLARLYAEQGRFQEIARLRERLLALLQLPEPLREIIAFALTFAELHGAAGIEIVELVKIHLDKARHTPGLPFSTLRGSAREVSWDRADVALRRNAVAFAGLDPQVALLSASEIEPASRRRMSWTAEAAMGIRLIFAEPERKGAPEPPRRPRPRGKAPMSRRIVVAAPLQAGTRR